LVLPSSSIFICYIFHTCFFILSIS
jgi:hypothetical protein